MRKNHGGTARVVLLAAVALVAVFAMSGQALGANDYNGGPTADSALYIPNDHTPVGVRWSAMNSGETVTGLAPDTTYSVKVRLSPTPAPLKGENRGWTWNPTTQEWVQESDQDWGKFPTVTTDANGEIPNTWTFVKFADDTKSGTYYLLVSLNLAAGSTFNNVSPPAVTVVNMRTSAAWVHNGAATEAAAHKRAEVSSTDETPVVFGTSHVEANGVDDDSNGVTDDEDYGPEGAAGDYRLVLPINLAANVLLNRVVEVADSTVSNPDEDIALGAGDTTAPDAPTALSATAEDRNIALTWTASSDNVGVTGYRVYRWVTSDVPYSTPIHALIATVPATQTTYDDTMDTSGIEYNYEVRAFDAATNVSARSNTSTATSVITTFFSDVAGTPYETAIYELANRGIISGFVDNTFRPTANVIRQQFAKMIVKTQGVTVTGTEICPFTDVVSGIDPLDPFYPDKYVAVCAAQGITQGKTATTFAPYDNMSRQQLITMIARAANLPEPPVDFDPGFSSGQFYPEEHYLNARKAAYAGLLNGLEGVGPSYDFLAPASRGECAQLLYNLLQAE